MNWWAVEGRTAVGVLPGAETINRNSALEQETRIGTIQVTLGILGALDRRRDLFLAVGAPAVFYAFTIYRNMLESYI
jgi:hypothetical protein